MQCFSIEKIYKVEDQYGNERFFPSKEKAECFVNKLGVQLSNNKHKGDQTMKKGIFIALEGPDGSGKSTISKKIKEYLENKKVNFVMTREPGGTPIGEEIRGILLDNKNTVMDNRTEALLYAAARAQHTNEKIKPLLEKGTLVISDRYVLSSLAYQGFARGLGIKEVMEINRFAMNGVYPDKILFFDISPETSLARKFIGREGDRLENEGVEFHKNTYRGYQEAIMEYSERVEIIDANGTVEETFAQCIKIIEDLLK